MYVPLHNYKRRKYKNNLWSAYSPKLKRYVFFQSDLEYDYWVLIETNSNITLFCEQPLKVKGLYNGKLHESIFDMWYIESNSHFFVEVKYYKALQPEHKDYAKNMRQIFIQKEWCESQNYKHIIMTEIEIRKNRALLNNLKTILPYLKSSPSEIIGYKIEKLLKLKPMSILELETHLSEHTSMVRPALYWLIYSDRVLSNIDQEIISNRTELRTNV